ncbi:Asp-tRNA(Asn)/Glu-tRNA(Gln) amidotransferase subunit GatB [Patescibacteria group bacterium]|nr:Asp-tRNA(Asn)/Glu-tRNA(Gln) amidotransferase subunit GatB [Patescibacteria group bacterium]
MAFLPVIGLEIHVRLKTKSKLFCRCPSVDETAPANSATCAICLGQPGVLPMLNEEAVRKAVRVGIALDAAIPDVAYFDRKHYFYPDLPKGYQITQYKDPVVGHGRFLIHVPNNPPDRQQLSIHIERAHMEEDAAKNVHQGASQATYVDFNRAGTPLLEIVTGPDFRSPQEAKIFLQELQALLRTIGASDADMEKGMMRCDANISLIEVDEQGKPKAKGLNPKTEIKNLNSFRSVERALQFEIGRQSELFAQGTIPHTTTRGWNDQEEKTVEQRVKESEADYRYFPEPDLPPLPLAAWIEEERRSLPETPSNARVRLHEEYGVNEQDATFLTARQWVSFFEETMSELGGWLETSDTTGKDGGTLLTESRTRLAKLAGSWMTNKLAALLAERSIETPHGLLDPENMAEFLCLLDKGKVAGANALKLLGLMLDTKSSPTQLMEQHGLAQVQDSAFLEQIVGDVIAKNEEQAAQVRAGKLPVLKWFVGQVMKASAGKANPESAEAELKKQFGV